MANIIITAAGGQPECCIVTKGDTNVMQFAVGLSAIEYPFGRVYTVSDDELNALSAVTNIKMPLNMYRLIMAAGKLAMQRAMLPKELKSAVQITEQRLAELCDTYKAIGDGSDIGEFA